MKRWLVVTPEYGEVVPITDEGQGPLEYGADSIEIEAESRRGAIVMGIRAMRQESRRYGWLRHCDHPYAGVKAYPVCGACFGSGRTNNHVDGETECSACEGAGWEFPDDRQ